MTQPARSRGAWAARGCAAVGTLGLVLVAGPAWALDLPAPLPSPAQAPALPSRLPAPVASLLPSPSPSQSPQPAPAPAQSPLPAPVASALAPVTSQLPGQSTSGRRSPSPAPAPKPQTAADRQQARSAGRVQPVTLAQAPARMPAVYPATAAMHDLPGAVAAPVAVPPMPVVPQLAPMAPAAGPAALPSPASSQGLPAIVVALALGTVTAAAGGQLAEMHARRT